jgi:hypothetical protein
MGREVETPGDPGDTDPGDSDFKCQAKASGARGQ